MQSPLSIKLLVSLTVLSMKERSKVRAGLEVVNHGSTAIDPQLYNCTLTANGRRVYAWDLAIQNGPREDAWHDLPPGKTVTISWPLGEALFEKPGDYHLVMCLGDQQSTADVRVTR